MAKNLLKKSYQLKGLKQIPYENLWNTKGVFTTIKIKGRLPNFVFLKNHLLNLNKSLKQLNIDFLISSKIFNYLIINNLKKNINYNHLLRIAVNKKKISISLRRSPKKRKFYRGILFKYTRPQPNIKNLYYKKILNISKLFDLSSSEVILFNNNSILEGCTTNVICVKNKILYIPKNNYYFGITLRFIKKYYKRKILASNITIEMLKSFDEIILVGSGKGIIALNNIAEIKWRNKSQFIYNELKKLYEKYV